MSEKKDRIILQEQDFAKEEMERIEADIVLREKASLEWRGTFNQFKDAYDDNGMNRARQMIDQNKEQLDNLYKRRDELKEILEQTDRVTPFGSSHGGVDDSRTFH